MLGIALTGCGEDSDGDDQGAEEFAYITDEPAAVPVTGQVAGGPTDVPAVAAVDDERFWDLIDQSGSSAGGSVEDQTETLTVDGRMLG